MPFAVTSVIRAAVHVLAIACVAISAAATGATAGRTYLVASEFRVGGSGRDRITDLAVDAAGNAYVSGVSGSYDFAGLDTAAFTNAGVDLRFVAKFPPTGRTPAFVAVVGAATKVPREARARDFGRDEVAGMALDAAGNALVVAYDTQVDFVVAGGPYRSGTGSKYVYKVATTGAVTRHSVALDPAIRRVGAIAVDATGALYVTGSAGPGLATTAGAPYGTDSVAANCIAPFALKLAASGQTVLYATYLGYSGTGGHSCGGRAGGAVVDPTGFAIGVDALGNAFVTGQAEPGLSASPGALDFGTKVGDYFYPLGSAHPTASHAFVAKLDPSGGLVYAARLGGSLRDRGTGIVVDAAGNAIVAGKTSSKDFPVAGGAGYPFVYRDCAIFNPEVGFLAKLSPNGSQFVFSGYLPLDGGQLDDCQARYDGTLDYQPARVALDGEGSILVAGYTMANNRDLPSTPGAIIPEPASIDQGVGEQLLQIYTSDGRTLLYSSPLGMTGVQGIGLDARQTLTIASDNALQRLVTGSLPLEIAAAPNPACAGQTVTVTATVAGTFDAGAVDFTVDGVVIGSAVVAGGVATKAITLSAGVRKLRAVYRGSGPFDGHGSIDLYMPVNQSGACP